MKVEPLKDKDDIYGIKLIAETDEDKEIIEQFQKDGLFPVKCNACGYNYVHFTYSSLLDNRANDLIDEGINLMIEERTKQWLGKLKRNGLAKI